MTPAGQGHYKVTNRPPAGTKGDIEQPRLQRGKGEEREKA